MMLWFSKILIRFFISIDSILFNFIATLYNLLIAISRTSVLTQGDIAQFAARIEILLGIFMLFKMSFSLITYIVNPDDFTDKQKGFGKLVQNSVISLVLLVLVPYIFQMAFNLQAKVLNDNLLAKLLLGEKITDSEGDGTSNATIIDTAGNQMAFQVMLPFFLPNYSLEGLNVCTNIYGKDDATGNKVFNPQCLEAMKSFENVDEQALTNYSKGIEFESLGLTFRANMAIQTTTKEDDAKFIIDYKFLLSTATAVITCLLLITFCIDVGVRSVKLAFLQLVYPIPVISFMDPKSGKDGIFSKWYKMCLSTFLSLFIRLLALYFGIYVITQVGHHGMVDVINGSEQTDGWVKLFVIIGILMFIKQLPKILENLGIKLDGDGKFTLNPLKKIEESAFGGKVLKKPNEMLNKLGKGALFAAPHALQTGGKKLIGGIDAAKNGKGFKQGWNRTHGKLYNAYHKKLDEWAPDSAASRKAEREGRENIHQMNEKMQSGMKAFVDAKGSDKNLNFSSQYRQSYDAVNAAKGEMYKAQANKQAELNRIEQMQQAGKISAEEAEKQIKDLNKVTGTAEKRYEVAKAKHDEMKKIYTKDAALEDAFDYYDKTASITQKARYVEGYFKDYYNDKNKYVGADATSIYSVFSNPNDLQETIKYQKAHFGGTDNLDEIMKDKNVQAIYESNGWENKNGVWAKKHKEK